MRARDALTAKRRRMPWMAVDENYTFEGPAGTVGLVDLFEGRRQLIVYRFFYDPGMDGYPERGCTGCSFLADQVAHVAHLNARDTSLAFVSRAPQSEIERWKARMGWEVPWYTSTDDFDADFGVDEWHGRTPSSATTTRSTARTSSTVAGTKRWVAPGRTSTSPHSGARRSGKTRRRATRRLRRIDGGTCTTSTRGHEVRRPHVQQPRSHEGDVERRSRRDLAQARGASGRAKPLGRAPQRGRARVSR